MVILMASEDATAATGLAEHPLVQGRHDFQVVTTIEKLETAVEALEQMDALLFTAGFSEGRGRELRETLRVRFPHLQTALMTDSTGKTVPVETMTDWLRALEEEGAGVRTEEEEPAGPFVLGDYELKEMLRSSPERDTFHAVQRSVNRDVILERLKPELLHDREAAGAFRAEVRAKARVSCPWIATVFEAQETGGVLFYTREMIRGRNMDELAAAKAGLTIEESLHLLRAAGEAVVWFEGRELPRESLRRHHLHQGADGSPRIANIALAVAPEPPPDQAAEIQAVAEGLMRITDFKSDPSRELAHITGLMRAHGPQRLTEWKSVLREARAGLHRLTEARTSTLEMGRDVPQPRRRKSRFPLAAGLIVLAVGGAAVAWYAKYARKPEDRKFAVQVHVPAGEFVFRDATRINLPDFWIDSHEVTIGEYAEFLTALAGNGAGKYDHPDQPKTKTSHEPADWAALLEAAGRRGKWNGYPVSRNCPVFNVDWWDAWAYAKWKGRRLPTEEEWDKAARGTNGRPWPWGTEVDMKRANTGEDYLEHPGDGKGVTDGHRWWCEVDAMPRDVSPWNVYGMAGNVSEWTSTWSADPDIPDETVPVFRGGDFRRKSAAAVTTPWLARSASYAQPFLGFRTVTSTPPGEQ